MNLSEIFVEAFCEIFAKRELKLQTWMRHSLEFNEAVRARLGDLWEEDDGRRRKAERELMAISRERFARQQEVDRVSKGHPRRRQRFPRLRPVEDDGYEFRRDIHS